MSITPELKGLVSIYYSALLERQDNKSSLNTAQKTLHSYLSPNNDIQDINNLAQDALTYSASLWDLEISKLGPKTALDNLKDKTKNFSEAHFNGITTYIFNHCGSEATKMINNLFFPPLPTQKEKKDDKISVKVQHVEPKITQLTQLENLLQLADELDKINNQMITLTKETEKNAKDLTSQVSKPRTSSDITVKQETLETLESTALCYAAKKVQLATATRTALNIEISFKKAVITLFDKDENPQSIKDMLKTFDKPLSNNSMEKIKAFYEEHQNPEDIEISFDESDLSFEIPVDDK